MTAAGSASTSAADILLSRAQDVLEGFIWEGEPAVGDGAVVVAYAGETGNWALIAGTFEDEALLVVYSALAEAIPIERLGPLFEYLCRANDGLPRGNFELDFEQHRVRFRTFLDLGEVDVEALDRSGVLTTLIRRIVLANVATMDIFLPGMRAVVAGEMTPEQADAAIEMS